MIKRTVPGQDLLAFRLRMCTRRVIILLINLRLLLTYRRLGCVVWHKSRKNGLLSVVDGCIIRLLMLPEPPPSTVKLFRVKNYLFLFLMLLLGVR